MSDIELCECKNPDEELELGVGYFCQKCGKYVDHDTWYDIEYDHYEPELTDEELEELMKDEKGGEDKK